MTALRLCEIDECGRKVVARGWCSTHYSRWRIHGDPSTSLYLRGNDKARFWIKVNKTAGCWEWMASKNEQGYGEFRLRGKVRKAHRVAYQLTRGEIPADKDLDHRCRNAGCVNPDHLRAVSNKQNTEHRGVDRSNTSGYRGVSFHKASKKWSAYVTHNGRRHYGGHFEDVHEAGAKAKAMRNKLFTHNDLDRSAT